MSLHEEAFYFHRVAQDIPENLLFALEGLVTDVDLIQVFENELGLIISKGYFVTPLLYSDEQGFTDLARRYRAACEKVGLPCAVTAKWSLDTEIGRQFSQQHPFASQQVMASERRLRSRYDASEGRVHEAGLAVVKLKG